MLSGICKPSCQRFTCKQIVKCSAQENPDLRGPSQQGVICFLALSLQTFDPSFPRLSRGGLSSSRYPIHLLVTFPSSWEAAPFPFAALAPLVFQRWDWAKFQWQSVLCRVKTCKQGDMIKTRFKGGQSVCLAGSGRWNVFFCLSKFMFPAHHLHRPSRWWLMEAHVCSVWRWGDEILALAADWHHSAAEAIKVEAA